MGFTVRHCSLLSRHLPMCYSQCMWLKWPASDLGHVPVLSPWVLCLQLFLGHLESCSMCQELEPTSTELPIFSGRLWSASWNKSASVMAWVAHVRWGHAGWPWPTSGKQAITCGGSTTGPSRSSWTRMALVSLWLTRGLRNQQKTTSYILRILQTTVSGTEMQVSSKHFSHSP